jgi:hypothetical protein
MEANERNGDWEMAAPLLAVRTRRWAWWSWRRRALDAEKLGTERMHGLIEERRAWEQRALRAESEAVNERRAREVVWKLKAEEVLRERTNLYERIESLEAELEEHRGNPG